MPQWWLPHTQSDIWRGLQWRVCWDTLFYMPWGEVTMVFHNYCIPGKSAFTNFLMMIAIDPLKILMRTLTIKKRQTQSMVRAMVRRIRPIIQSSHTPATLLNMYGEPDEHDNATYLYGNHDSWSCASLHFLIVTLSAICSSLHWLLIRVFTVLLLFAISTIFLESICQHIHQCIVRSCNNGDDQSRKVMIVTYFDYISSDKRSEGLQQFDVTIFIRSYR